ncbi:MAG: hypothetical protein IH946_07325 [Bacteroidetes bacterium]|nr:hypothetical protein [Bacteroidota bacterium]
MKALILLSLVILFSGNALPMMVQIKGSTPLLEIKVLSLNFSQNQHHTPMKPLGSERISNMRKNYYVRSTQTI